MTYSIGSAVTVPNGAAASPAPTKRPGSDDESDDEPQEGRAIVIMDADVFTDRVFQNRGNWDLGGDVLQWLAGSQGPVGRIESVEDTAIEHSRGQDSLWFGLTVGLVPFLVLAFGLIFSSRRRKQKPGRPS